MKLTFLKIAASTLLLAGPAMAQPQPPESPDGGEVCRVPPPVLPTVGWSGQASYRAKVTVKDGRVVGLEVRTLTNGVERRASRALIHSISETLRAARCQAGDHVFEKTFDFDLPPARAASGAS